MAGGGGEQGWSQKRLCICACVCRGQAQVATSSVLSGVIDGFLWGGAGQARPAWRRLLFW